MANLRRRSIIRRDLVDSEDLIGSNAVYRDPPAGSEIQPGIQSSPSMISGLVGSTFLHGAAGGYYVWIW